MNCGVGIDCYGRNSSILCALGSLSFFVYVNVQEWKVVFFFFFFHCKLYLVVESIEVVQKFFQFSLAMRPDDESIIYISELAYRFVCGLSYCFLLKILNQDIRSYRRKWRAHFYPVHLFVELSIKT